jgi:hypothetical protein
MARSNEETQIQIALCNYVRYLGHDLIFNVDLSGMNLSKTQSGQAKSMRSSSGFPDFVLYEPRGQYKALFIELKTESTKVFRQNGKPDSDHIINQLQMIDRLNKKGYYAVLCQGFDNAKECIDWYMGLKSL